MCALFTSIPAGTQSLTVFPSATPLIAHASHSTSSVDLGAAYLCHIFVMIMMIALIHLMRQTVILPLKASLDLPILRLI